MKKLWYVLLLVFIALTFSCEIGLGSSVDTDPPTIDITTPPVESIIRDSFLIGGNWSDDGDIAGVSVSLKKTDGTGSEITLTGSLTENRASAQDRGSGTWSTLVKPVAEDGTKLVEDGSYQATVTIQDTVGRTTVQSITFAIDNTAPVIVLTRPSTAVDSLTSDTYGQTFSLEGQAADTNNVSLIEVNIYRDAECTDYVHTVPLKNVPNSINMDIAKFTLGDTTNDYYKIYGSSTTDAGAKDFYCRLVAYDGAKRYPADGTEQTEADKKGNATETYYLYKDVATSVLQNYKITEVYSMFSGTFVDEDTAARTVSPADVMTLLASHQKTEGKFTLNPKNNPTFVVTGRSPLSKGAEGLYDFTGNELANGSQVVIEVSPGLDGILLDETSLKVYAQEYTQSGSLGTTRLYSETTMQESGTSYKFITVINRDKGFEIGKSYLFGVEGQDQNSASIEPAAEAYGFFMGSSGRSPVLTISAPSDTNTYISENSISFTGSVTVELGKPEIEVYLNDEEEPIHTITGEAVTFDSKTATEEKYNFSWTYNDFGSTSRTDKFSFVANLAGSKSQSVEKTVVYDIEKPTININSIGPVVERNNRNNNINGTFKIQGMIQDNVQFKDAKLEVFQGGTKLPAYSRDELTTNGSFEYTLNTTALTDNSDIEIKITAHDRAGNESLAWNNLYHIDQSTDKPVITHQLGSSFDITGSTIAVFNSNGSRKNIFSQSESMYFTVDDDDTLSGSSIKIQKCDSSGTVLASEANVEADTFTNNISAKTPADVGIYKVTLFAKDNFYTTNDATPNNFTLCEFLIKVTGKGPDVSTSYDKYKSTVTAAANYPITFTMNGEAPFKLFRNFDIQANSVPAIRGGGNDFVAVEDSASQNITSTYSYTITYPQGTTQADQLKFRVYDRDDGYTDVVFTPGFDNDAPTVEIKSPRSGKINTSALNETTQFSGTSSDPKSGVAHVYYKFVNDEGPSADSITWNPISESSNGPFTIDLDFIEGTTPQTNKLEEGCWNLYVYAEDAAGNKSDVASLHFDINLKDPELSVTIPYEGVDSCDYNESKNTYYFTGALSGTITASDTADTAAHGTTKTFKIDSTENSSVTYNSNNWTIAENNFSENTEHSLEVIATDRFGKTKKESFTVYRDTSAPVLGVTNPGNISTSSIIIEGSVTDANGVGVDSILWDTSVTGSFTNTATYTAGATSWSLSINDLGVEGTKNYYFKAKDKLGNISAAEHIEFVFDSAVPGIAIDTQYNSEGTIYKTAAFSIAGTAWDSNRLSTVVIEKDGTALTGVSLPTDLTSATTEANGAAWSKEFVVGSSNSAATNYIADGRYNFNIFAKDIANKKSTEITKIVCVDTVAPSITLNALPTKENTKESGFTFRGNAVDVTSGVKKVWLKIAAEDGTNAEVEVAGTDSWYCEVRYSDTTWANVFASEGVKTITMRAEDIAGNSVNVFTYGANSNIASTNFTFDKANPVLTINESTISEFMPEAGLTITGSASDSYKVKELKVIQNDGTNTYNKIISLTQNAESQNWSVEVPFNSFGTKVVPVTNTTYKYKFELSDLAGNKDTETPKEYTTTADFDPPTVAIQAPDNKTGDNSVDDTTFWFSGTYEETNISAVYGKVIAATTAAPAASSTPLTEASWTDDGWEKASLGTGSWKFYKNFKVKGSSGDALEEGSYKVHIYAVDKAGNVSTIASEDFDVDMAAPVIATKLDSADLTLNTEQIKNAQFTLSFMITESNGLASTPVSLTVKKDSVTMTSGYTVKSGSNTVELSAITTGNLYTIEIPSAEDALYTYEITATDIVNRSTSVTRKVRLDTTPPVITLTSPDVTKWQSMNSFTVLGTATDGSGIQGVYYKLNPTGTGATAIPTGDVKSSDTWTSAGWTAAGGTSSWNIPLSALESRADHKLYLAAVDVNGMASASALEYTLKVDASEPTISVTQYNVGTDAAAAVSGMVYLNRADGRTLTVYGSYSDNLSLADLSNFTFAVSGNAVTPTSAVEFYSDAACTQAISGTSAASAYWKATFDKDISAGSFTVTGRNGAGGVKQEQAFTIKEDTGLPTITNVSLSDSYVVTSGTEKTYYVKNTDKTFTIEGAAADTNSGVKSVTLSITNTAAASDYGEGGTVPADITNITNSGNLAEWKFEGINIQTWKKGATAAVTVTDNAGNVKYEILNITFDTEGPSAVSEIDANQKNLYFRLGNYHNDTVTDDKDEDVGGKYSIMTWGNDTSIDLRGRFDDNTGGSGVKEIYYKVSQTEPASDLSEADVTDLINSVVLEGTGKFILSDPVTKNVSYTTESNTTASKEITTNFRETLIGFTEGANYLILVAVDNVGNKKIFSADVDFGGATHKYYSLKINIDRTAPEITSSVSDTLSSNATGTITLSGSVTDSAAGVRKLNIYVPTYKTTVDGTVGTQLQTKEIEVLKTSETDGTLIACTGSTLSNGTWEYTLDARWLAGQNEKITIKAKAWDKAGETGNWTSADVASVLIDTEAPKIKLDKPSDADEATTGIQINKSIKLTGSGSDNNNKFTIQKIQVKKSTDTDWTDITSATVTGQTTIVMPNISIVGSDNFAVTGFDTTKLDDNATYLLRAVAKDEAGNTAYSDTVNANETAAEKTVSVVIDQNSDRPVITLSNLEITSNTYLKGTQTLYGVVTDDDGTVQSFEYSDDNGNNWHPKGTSSWSITNIPEQPNNTFLFKITDAAGTEFITTASDALSRPNVTDGTTPVNGNLSFGVVVNKPEYRNVKYYKFDAVETNPENQWTEFDPANATIGGLRFTKVKAQLEAKSSAFIDEITASYNSTSYGFNCSGTYNDGNWHTWNSEEITLGISESLHGKQAFEITITDTVDFTNQIKEEFTLDNKAPTIDISRPSTLIGQEETIRGSVNESSTLYYAVSRYCEMKSGGTGNPQIPDETKPYSILSSAAVNVIPADTIKKTADNTTVLATAWKRLENNDSDSSWYVYFDAQYRSGSTTEFETDHTTKLGTYLTENYLGITSTADVRDSKYGAETPVYFWIKAVDACGNVTVKEQQLAIDPQGERPRVEITYPTNVIKDGNSVAPTLGGTIRMTGTAEDNNSAKYAWIQIDRDGNGFSKDDLQYLKDSGYSIGQISTNTKLTSVPNSIGDGNNAASDYGVWVEVKGSGWSLAINENQEFNPDSGKANLNITVCATDADEPPHVSLPRSQIIEIDAETPYSENLRLVNYETNASMTYSEGANISGIWYLTGKFIDDDSGIASIKYNGNEAITGTPDANGKYYPRAGDTNAWFKRVDRTVGTQTLYDYEFSVPLGKAKTDATKVGSDSVLFVVQENTTQKLSINPTYTITFDNKAPVLTYDTANDNVSLERNVQNSSGFYYFGAIASEEDENNVSQSGVERIAFYFTRDLGYGLHSGTETHDLFDVMICHENTDSEDTSSGNMILNYTTETAAWVKDDGLYWHKVTGASISDRTVTIGTANNNIHKRGIAKINGVIYVIESVDGTTITLDKAPGNSASTDVLFAVCNVIDKSGKNGTSIQTSHGYGYGYYESRANDDGDRITETFNKQGTDWIFDAAINSKNLPDGPITLHLVAFDKAGNIAEWSSPAATEANRDTFFVVSNNAPRIAGMFIGTDENGDGSVTGTVDFTTNTSDSGEFISYHNIYVKGYDKQNNAKTEVTFPVQSGDTPASAITVKGKTVIKPEIVGGNGSISYSYSVYKHSSGQTWQTTSEYSANGIEIISVGTTDDSIAQMKAGVEGIVLNVEDFVQKTNDVEHISDGNYKKFTFSFSDSTPGYLATSNSSNSATMNVIMNVDLRDSDSAKNFILPFYWNSSSSNSLFKQSKSEGHIELAKDWVLSDGYGTGDEYDVDPKVSGKIKIEGIASDNILLKNITVNFNKVITGFAAASTDVTLATYSGGSWTPATGHALTDSGDLPTGASWAVSVEKATYGQLRKLPTGTFDLSGDTAKADTDEVPESSQKYGHVVHWTLYLDTANLSDVADTNVLATAKAADRGSPTWNGSAVQYGSTTVAVTNEDVISGAVTVSGTSVSEGELSGKYQMDVVPYINKLFTAISETAGEDFARSATGKYIVKGNDSSSNTETVRLYGFNLDSVADAITVGSTSIDLDEGDTDEDGLYYYTFDVGTSTVSGDLSVTINGVQSLNNKNKNPTFTSTTNDTITAVEYNSQANGVTNNRLTDDVSLWVWDLGYFLAETNITSPMLKMDKAGNYYMSYGYGVPKMYVRRNNEARSVDGSYNKFHNTNVIYDDNGNLYAVGTNTDRVSDTSAKFVFYTPYEAAGTNQLPTEITAEAGEYSSARDSKRHLEKVYNASTGVYDINRVKLPKMTSYTDGNTAYIGIAYYDFNNTINPVKVRFGSRNGTTITGGITGNTNGSNQSNNPDTTDGSASGYHIIASDDTTIKGGQYAAVGIVPASKAGTTNNVGVVAWYDASVRRVAYSYNTNPDSAVVGDAWQTNAKYLDGKYTGWHVDLTVDDNGGIHIAYYNSAKGDLKYVYLSSYNATPSEPVTVDSYLSVGTNITINTRLEDGKYVPYIYYYNSSSNQTPNSIKVAWREDMTTLRDGARADKTAGGDKDTFTGAWESMTIPTENIPVEATVCGGVPSTATGTNAYMNSTVFLGYMSDTGYEKAYIKK